MSGHSNVSTLPLNLPDTTTGRVAALFDAHHVRLYRLARRLVADDQSFN